MKAIVFFFGISLLFFSCTSEHEQQLEVDEVHNEVQKDQELVKSFESAEEMKAALQSNELDFDFYASFTEPFFTIYVVGQQALIVRMDEEDELFELLTSFNPRSQEQEILIGELNCKITKGKGSDGMSDIHYPYVVEYGEFTGGGATERMREN